MLNKNFLITIIILSFSFFNITNTFAETKKHLNIVFIGNSITYGAGLHDRLHEAPPTHVAIYLGKQSGIGNVKYSNQGVSGCTTIDYLPSTRTLFSNAIKAADQFYDEDWSTLVFSIMLGTNDSAIKGTNGCPVSPKQYYNNMSVIINELLARYPKCKIILHRPIWYSPNTHNRAMYLKEGLKRLKSYFPQIKKLVKSYHTTHPDHVYLGDTEGFDFFKENYDKLQHEKGNSGIFFLHPNKEGAKDLGELWGKAIYRSVIL